MFGKILNTCLKLFSKEDVVIEKELVLADLLYPYSKSYEVFNRDQRKINLHSSSVQEESYATD